METLLGQQTHYPTLYCADILTPIARSNLRQSLPTCAGITQGMDWWHVFELSWLNNKGLPEVRLAELGIDANSPCMIESKSLKLYFNSLNQHTFDNEEQLIKTIITDISMRTKAPITCRLISVDGLMPTILTGVCLDHIASPAIHIAPHPDPKLLTCDHSKPPIHERLYSHLFRSHCPVTNQPDWASILIDYQGAAIAHEALLNYLLSYRQHAAFHEHCVEHIFADLWQTLQPSTLMVYAMFTRRGGIDINPCRVSHHHLLPTQPFRLSRQ